MRLSVLFFLAMAIAFASTVFADSLEMTDGRSFPSTQVDSFQADGGGIFSIRIIENGAPGAEAHAVQAATVKMLQIREAGDQDPQPRGRKATLLTMEGRTFPGVTVRGAWGTPQGLVFRIVPATEPPGSPGHDFSISRVRTIDFTGTLIAIPTPTPAVAEPAAPTFAPSAFDNASGDGDSGDAADSDSQHASLDDEGDVHFPGAAGNPALGAIEKFANMGIGAQIMLSIVMDIILSFIIAIYMLLAGKLVQATDYGFKKAYGTAWMLLVVAHLAAIPLKFFGCFGLIPGILMWYFMSRAVIMGMMEITEGKAFLIIILYGILYLIGMFISLFAIIMLGVAAVVAGGA